MRRLVKHTDMFDDWKEFEAEVRRLLAIQGWRIRAENITGHKKIDAYAEKIGDFGKKRRLAVECKHYSSPMTQEQVTEVFANYLPLIDQNAIDQVLLVTLNDIAPSAKTFSDTSKKLIHITYMELLNSLMDFSSYVRGLIAQYSQDTLNEYYVAQNYKLSGIDEGPKRHVAAGNVEGAIMSWVASADFQPIAILAGYGMGKTTLARRIAYLLAIEHSKRAINRIPILIKLEDIASEQSLEGLLGKHFTTTSIVGGYSFDIFMELNKRGRFVLILDGFDEMKQLMTWEVMRYNFSQLNRLVAGNSKVLLGGRPSAFLNEEEYLEALRGKRVVLGQLRQIPDWPEYKEFYLQPFSHNQITKFIGNYAKVIAHRRIGSPENLDISNLLTEMETSKSSRLLNLAKRPVQLKMMIEILPTWEKELDSLTLTALYSEFIDLMIRREMGKRARQRFSLEQRREFATNLAYFMWTTSMGTAITINNIPEHIFKPFNSNNESLDEVRRDLLSACFLEVKQPDGVYFPHRSFQEYLVAERIVSLVVAKQFPFNSPMRINPEVQEFIVGQMGFGDFTKLKSSLLSYRGVVQDWVIDLLLRFIDNPFLLVDEMKKGTCSPWIPVTISVGIIKQRWELSLDDKRNLLTACFMKPPAKIPQKDKWLQVLVLLTIIHKEELEEAGINFEGRIVAALVQAGTYERFGNSKKLPVAELIRHHINTGYCHLHSWSTLVKEAVTEAYDIRRIVGRNEEWKPYDFPHSRKKWPHKLGGVTRKKEFKKPH